MKEITSFTDESLLWLNNPKLWISTDTPQDNTGNTEGSGGDYDITEKSLLLKPPAFKDFWARTFYEPLLIKKDASAYVCRINAEDECSIFVDCAYTPSNQFDQAGIFVYLDDDHWVKCGLEYCDGGVRLSVVVCNVYSDWSTQPWDFESVRLRCHKIKHSSTIVIEATPVDYDDWHFIRIAHLSSLSINQSVLELMGDSEKDWLIGPFAACPMQQRGCVATFTNLRIGPKVDTMHSSDSSSMVKRTV